MKWLVVIANIAGVLLSVLAILFFRWAAPFLLIAAPISACIIVALSEGTVALIATKTMWAKSLPGLFFVPILILFVLALQFGLVDYRPALLAAIGPAALLFAAALGTDHLLSRKFDLLALVALLSFAFGYGVIVELNGQLGSKLRQDFATRVTNMEERTGKATGYFVDLASAPEGVPTHGVRVTNPIYRSTRIGGPICVGIWRGRLAIDWYEIKRCGLPPPP